MVGSGGCEMNEKWFPGVDITDFLLGFMAGTGGLLGAIIIIMSSGFKEESYLAEAIIGCVICFVSGLLIRYQQNKRDGRKWWK